MKKYIGVITEERKNKELDKQMRQEIYKKMLFIENNENVFEKDLRSELLETILNFYDNDEQFQEVQKRLEQASHEIDILWQIATDEEKNEIEQYFTKQE